MESRRFKRVVVDMPAEIIVGDSRYASSIENLSSEGIYIVTAPLKSPLDFVPDTPIELRFSLPSGERLHLSCRTKWSYQTPPHGYTNSIGLEVIDPPYTYMEFLKNL